MRLVVLLALLLATVAWAVKQWRRGPLRADWEGGVRVAVLLLATDAVSSDAATPLRDALGAAEDWAAAEAARFGVERRPFDFVVLGPFEAPNNPPAIPGADATFFQRVRAAWRFWRFRQAADALAEVEVSAAAVEVYVVLDPESRAKGEASFEGVAQEGQRWGFVRGNVDAAFELAVAVLHETFHCVGATDKYDEAGRPTAAARTVDRGRPTAELMVGEIAGHAGRLPRSFDELEVGPVTAEELGW